MVRILVSDIDGVLTDGTVLLNAAGNEEKRISFRDLDALFKLHRAGWIIAFVTGERGPWVEMIRTRLPYKYFYDGCKDKLEAVIAPTIAAVALGGIMVERHVTESRDLWGSDQALSLEPRELRQMVDAIREVEAAMGSC